MFEFMKYGVILLWKLTALKKSLKLREEAAAKEVGKAKNVETSAEKLHKILKEEKR